jgi:RNA polymerase sigma factor (sigma-70 family)
MMDQERQWIRKIKRKSCRKAANQLISKYYKEIYAYVFKQTMNKELAMDITQEIFLHMLQSIRSFDEKKASFRTWLYKLGTYRIIDYYRSKYYKYHHLAEPIEEYEPSRWDDFTLTLEYKEDVERILHLLVQFDSSIQQIFRLKLFSDYTFSEVADILNLPEATVKTKYYSALKKIKNKMRGDGQ